MDGHAGGHAARRDARIEVGVFVYTPHVHENSPKTFAHCRVAASQLATLGCPELIARTRHEYEQIAIRLGNDRDYSRCIRAKVWKAREESPLFDCQAYAGGLEALYSLMWDKHARGEPADHIAAVAGVANDDGQ